MGKLAAKDVARICHEANAALCQALGDSSQVGWLDAPTWQQGSAVSGVQAHLADPDMTPEDSHNSWLKVKRADGWQYGNIKDPARKLHPCMVPYAQLPREQQLKDYLFSAIVGALRDDIKRD